MSAPRRGHFWPKGYNPNNLGRGPLGEAMYQISKTRAFWFQMRFLKVFSIQVYLKHVGLRAGPFLAPGQPLPLLEAMYQISKAWTFCFQTRFKIFKVFPYMGLCKTSDTRHGAIFDPRAII